MSQEPQIVYVERKRRSFIGGCGTLVILGFIFALIIASQSGNRKSNTADKPNASDPPRAKARRDIDFGTAYRTVTGTIKNKLKAPSSARFSSMGQTKMAPYGYHQWAVLGFVDSQNSFGAMIREQWSAIVEYNSADDSYSVPACTLGEHEYGSMPTRAKSPEELQAEAKAEADRRAAIAQANQQRKQSGDAAAFKHLLELAKSGDSSARYRLAQLYERGQGTDPDPAEALRWYRLAAASGSSDASNAAIRLQSRPPAP